MPALLIAQPSGPNHGTLLSELVGALQREHGYQVLVVEVPADILLLRLAAFDTYLAYEALDGVFIAQPFVIRWRPQLAAPAEIEFLPPPTRLVACAQYLLDLFRARLLPPAASHPPQYVAPGGLRWPTRLHRFTSRGSLGSLVLPASSATLPRLPCAS